MRAALAQYDEGTSMRQAAARYGIPYSTFRELCYGVSRSRKRGVQSVLTMEEERELVKYILAMCNQGLGLSPLDLKLKVAEITRSRSPPFKDGIPGDGWYRWFQKRHPELTLRAAQVLSTSRAKGLCKENVHNFYSNLRVLYTLHNYPPERIWNCDESGVQAGRNGDALVISQRGARQVQKIIPDEREWLSVLVCVNAARSAIPSFYIFKGKRFRQNYIERCESGATMAMQGRALMTSYLYSAWMTSYLFSAWISHFNKSINEVDGISPSQRHLLVLDGHGSHVTIAVAKLAQEAGLDIVTLPVHTSHSLQPLDVSVFSPFKSYFRRYRDY